MPVASKRGAPRLAKKQFEAEKIAARGRRRCHGPLTRERAKALHADGQITDGDYAAIMDMFETLEAKSK